jgi:hypothetical protein
MSSNDIKSVFRDLSPLCRPCLYDLDDFDQEIFNLMWHLKQSRNEIMSWPSSDRKRLWDKYKKQVEVERKAMAQITG